MESRQGEPESEDSREALASRKLYRAVIVQALKDLGNGELGDVVSLRGWRENGNFDLICEKACWDSRWVQDLFLSVEDLHSKPKSVRTEVTLQCVRLLKGLALE